MRANASRRGVAFATLALVLLVAGQATADRVLFDFEPAYLYEPGFTVKDHDLLFDGALWHSFYIRGIEGVPGERHKIWPIVQLSDWGEKVEVEQVRSVLDHGTRLPATGVMVFAWGSLRRQTEKVDELTEFYRAIAP